jgi:hypothetical protein
MVPVESYPYAKQTLRWRKRRLRVSLQLGFFPAPDSADAWVALTTKRSFSQQIAWYGFSPVVSFFVGKQGKERV